MYSIFPQSPHPLSSFSHFIIMGDRKKKEGRKGERRKRKGKGKGKGREKTDLRGIKRGIRENDTVLSEDIVEMSASKVDKFVQKGIAVLP